MVAKKVVIWLLCTVLFLGVGFYRFVGNRLLKPTKEVNDASAVAKTYKPKPVIVEKKKDLYSETPYDLPLMSIYEISKLTENLKRNIDEILEAAQGFYILKEVDGKVLILLQNPVVESNTYSRHDLQYVELYPDGRKIFHNAGYAGIDGEISSSIEQAEDDWFFDKTTELCRPLKHIARDEKGKTKFTEIWNYDVNNPVRYQMKDSRNKVVSILKEIQENDSNYRREHIFYDNDGKTVMSVIINYEGANISRFTYYNAHHTIDSISIISEYTDGLKTKELVYDEDYQLINTYITTYVDGVRKELFVYDSEGNELAKI